MFFTRARRKEFELFVCPVILEEFERILSHKIKAPQDLVGEALGIVLEASEVVQPTAEFKAKVDLGL